jgi:hypothetical protein
VVPFTEVALSAVGGSCETSCPIANGTPSCLTGTCQVGSCDGGWYDTDQSAATGCECKEIGTDPGSFCADATYLGRLRDKDKTQVTFTGILPIEDDIDVVRFFAEDASDLFSESFDVKVRLDSADPSIRFCIYRYRTSNHQNECYWTDENCPTTRYYRRNGTLGSGDDADFTIKVFRDPNAAPTCTPYTLFISNGR